MMPGRMLLVVGAVLARCWLAVADPIVSDARIGVFLFGQPAFYSEVAVMVRNNTCLSLDNNMWVCLTPELAGGADEIQG